MLKFRTYWPMHPDYLGLWFWLGIIFGPMAGVFGGIFIEQPGLTAGVVAAPFVLRLIHFGARMRSGFRSVRSLSESVSISLDGWDRLFDSDVTQSATHWLRTVTLDVEADDADERLEDFVARANRCFYPKHGSASGAHGDPRTKWTRDGGRLSGSANLQVLGRVAQLVLSLDAAGATQRIRIARSGPVHDVPRFGHIDTI